VINEVITIDAGPAVAELDALASAAEGAAAKIDAAFKGIKVPSLGGSGAANMARSMDAAATKMSAAVDKMEASFAKLKASGAEAGAAMADIGKAGAESAAGLGDAAKGANDAAASYARLGKASRDSAAAVDSGAVAAGRASGSHSKLKEVMLGAGVAAAYSIDKAMKFQSQMLLLHTQAGVSVKDTQAMSQGALKISTQTGQSLGDVAESAYHVASNMASMGTSVPRMLEATKVDAEGASVGHANMVDVTNALTAAIASGIPGVKDYQQAMGALNATVGAGDMSMQDLSEAFGTGMVASVKGYGLSLKDVGAGLAVFGDNNIRGAKAGTDMRMAVQSLAVPASSAKKELASLGLTTNSLAKDMQSGGLLKALDDLSGKFKAHGITAKNEGQVITDLFGKKAGVGLSLLLEQMDRLKSKYPDITEGANKFNAAWKATQATPQQKWKELTAGLQASAAGFGTELLPAFTKVTGFADRLLADINGSKGGAKAMAVAFGGITALFAGKKLLGGIESSIGTLGKLGSFLNIPGLRNLGTGSADAAATANGRLAASANAAAAALGRVAGAGDEAAVGEAAAGKGGGLGSAAGASSKMGSVLGAAVMTAAGAWIVGHLTGEFLPKATRQQQQQYRQQAPGWLQGPTDFVFGSKAPSVWAHAPKRNSLPAALIGGVLGTSLTQASLWKGWYHDVFGGGGPQPTLAPHQWQSVLGPNAPATYPGGRPFYGEVPAGVAKPVPAARPAVPAIEPGAAPAIVGRFGPSAQPVIKPKVDGSGIAGAMANIANAVKFKPVKLPAPDLGALTAAKGKAQAAAVGITQAMDSAMKKPAKLPAPDLSAGSAAAGKARGIGSSISAGLAAGILAGEGAVVAAATKVANDAAAAMAHAAQTRSPSKKTIKTGQDIAAGLVVGLQGGQSAIDAAATAIGKNAAKAADIAAIDAASKKLLGEVPKGDTALTRMLKADTKDLERMANTRAKLEQEISDSEQVAKSMVSGASIMNSLNAVNPAGAEPIASAAIVQGQQYQATSMKQFAQSLTKLQAMGLNATSLSQIAQAGPDQGLGIAQGIAGGGKQAVRQLNQLQKQMQSSAAAIGNVAGPAMYQAGKDMGVGLASGLKSELGSLDKAIAKLADSMVHSVSGHAKTAAHKAAKATAGAVASGASAGVSAAAGGSAGAGSLGSAGASLSHAGAALSASAAALTAAASALRKDAAGGTLGASHARHPVAAGGGSGGGHYGTPAYMPPGGAQHVHYHTHVNQTVQGNVHAMTDLVGEVQNAVLLKGIYNWQTGIIPPGRAG